MTDRELDLDQKKLRDIPGWERNAPIPICMGGDYRALTFCCKPGSSLAFAYECRRDKTLSEIGLSPEEFMNTKENFSKENDWDSDIVCFGSISYCCMRRGGCPRRDLALSIRYPSMTKDEFMEIYFSTKKELARIILENIKNPDGKKKVKAYLDLF